MVKSVKHKESKKKVNSAGNSNLVVWILVLVIIQIVLSIGIILSINSPNMKLDDSKINSIEKKVNAIDNFFRNNVRGYDSSGSSSANQGVQNSGNKIDVSADDDPWIGSKDAKVEVIEFSDYQCPFCRKFWRESFSKLKQEYIDTGKIKFVYRDFPLNFHQGAKPAAIAGNCVREQLGNEGYFKYHDIVFAEQDKKGVGTIQFGESEVLSWVKMLDGINMDKFNKCYNDPKQKAEVEADFADGAKAGVSGTPSFFINGNLIVGAQPYSVIKAEIEKALKN